MSTSPAAFRAAARFMSVADGMTHPFQRLRSMYLHARWRRVWLGLSVVGFTLAWASVYPFTAQDHRKHMPKTGHLLIAIVMVSLVAAVASVPRPADASLPGSSSLRPVRTEYLPSKHGFGFRNSFSTPEDPKIVRAVSGRCGGMSFASLDYFNEGMAPGADWRMDDYLLTRTLDSIAANIARFALWSVWPDSSDSPLIDGVGQLTRAEEVPRLAKALESGPVPLGLVRARSIAEIGRNHQVVAYAIEQREGTVIISVYDSCQPGADDVTLEFDIADPEGEIVEYAGDWVVAKWRGMFVEQYVPVSPPR